MYCIEDEESLKIIDEHHLKKTIVVFDETSEQERQKGLDELLCYTTTKLNDLAREDDLGGLVYLEAHRFLCDCIEFQTRYECYQHRYYQSILELFHNFGFLTHKKEVRPYKQFKHKNMLFKLNIVINNETRTYRYMSSKNMSIDFGRYAVDRLVQRYKRGDVLTLDVIKNLLDS